jgi:hypothetical protein
MPSMRWSREMSEIDGGPAFPTTKPLESWGDPNRGMSLRDYFAGEALKGVLSNHELLEMTDRAFLDLSTRDAAAVYAYAVADSMLKARAGEQEPGA